MQQHATLGHISLSSFPCSLAFRATIHSRFTTFKVIMSHVQFGVQSHFSSFSVQSHHRFSVSAFRAIITSQFRRSEPSLSLFNFGVQSHHCCFPFGVQSRFFSLTFRVTITFQFQRLEPSSCFQFDVQSHHHRFSASAFRAIMGFQFDVQSHISQFDVQSRILSSRRSEPPSLVSFGVQSHHRVFSLTFRVIITASQLQCSEPSPLLNFGVQSHHCRFLVSAFRAIIVASQFWRLESSLSLFNFGVQGYHRFLV